jgi:serine protease AprX
MHRYGTRASLDTGRRIIAAALGALLLTLVGGAAAHAGEARGEFLNVIVQGMPGERAAAAKMVRSVGGQVGRPLNVINGFAAHVPVGAVDSLNRSSSVRAVTPNGRVTLSSHSTVNPGRGKGTSYDVTRAIGARKLWERGYTGSGVDVALIDSGVAPVKGLRAQGKILHGPDFSWESQAENLRYLDTYGHGTHMAGLISGREGAAGAAYHLNTHNHFGVAPDARLISLKVADAKGLTDVTQVIAAIDWVIAHRRDAGMNIRVLSLSFGTDGTQTYLLDPLSFAVERAWKKGIVVVAAAGNTGFGDMSLNNPAFNPFVVAVGASDTQGTAPISDDVVPSWSTTGNILRKPDVVAPGTSIVSYRTRRSYIDQNHPEGRIGDRYFKGSGTSQATAVTSGAVALLLDHRPNLTPDQVKKALNKSATRLSGASSSAQGNGLINLPAAMSYSSFFLSGQLHLPGTGLGSLVGARGSHRVLSSGQQLVAQTDIFGQPWLASTITNLGNSLLGVFNGSLLSGTRFVTDPVLGLVWNAVGWERRDWTGSRWTDESWTGSRWTGSRWTGSRWTGSRWTGSRWTGDTWSSASWGNP